MKNPEDRSQLSLLGQQSAPVQGGTSARTRVPKHSRTAKPGQPSVQVPQERRSGDDRRASRVGGRRATDPKPAPPTCPSSREDRPVTGRHRIGRSVECVLVDVKGAAEFLGVSVSWVYKRVEDGTLPVVRLNGFALRFSLQDLKTWLESHKDDPTRK